MDVWMLLIGNIPALICLIVGLALVIVEMFIPGFGVPGISGVALVVAGIIISGGTTAQMLALAGLVLLVLLLALPFCLRAISKGRLDKAKIVLNTVSLNEGEAGALQRYMGCVGVAHTTLRPAGIGTFDGRMVNVVSSGEFIREGDGIVVERVEGNKVVVAKAKGNQ